MPANADKKIQRIIVQRTLDEAKEVLKLNPLPEDWIWDIAGGHARPWPDDNIESCKQWIEWIIKKLENQCRLYKKEPNEDYEHNHEK